MSDYAAYGIPDSEPVLAKYELRNIFRKHGESNYHVYKCLCKYKGGIVEDTPKYFRCRILQEPNYHLIKDISGLLFFQKMGLEVVEDKVDKKGSLRSLRSLRISLFLPLLSKNRIKFYHYVRVCKVKKFTIMCQMVS